MSGVVAPFRPIGICALCGDASRLVEGGECDTCRQRLHLSAKRDVYLIEAVGSGRVKIGSAVNSGDRLEKLTAACPFPIRRIAVVDGSVAVESRLHHRFRHLRAWNEWFHDTPEIREWFAERMAVAS